jgi:hypothetical protein
MKKQVEEEVDRLSASNNVPSPISGKVVLRDGKSGDLLICRSRLAVFIC